MLILGVRPAHYAHLSADLLQRCRGHAEKLSSPLLGPTKKVGDFALGEDQRRRAAPPRMFGVFFAAAADADVAAAELLAARK